MDSVCIKPFAFSIVAAISVLLNPISALGSGLLTGTVTFDSTTSLYTYSYTLQNLGGNGRINQFYIAVNSLGGAGGMPRSPLDPPGWSGPFFAGPSTSFCDTANLVCGGEYGWIPPNGQYVFGGLPEGETLAGFSFQTTAAPMVTNQNTYSLFFPDFPSLGIYFEAGSVVVPDFHIPDPPPLFTPESPSWALLLAGCVCIALTRRQLRRSAAKGD